MATAALRPGMHPFWFWNTRMDRDTITTQLTALAQQGCRGVFIHPRQGLAQAYLGTSFLGLVRFAVREAARLGLTPHLYDEYPYPSGSAGGLVTLGRPECWARRLVHRHQAHPGGTVRWNLPAGEVLACAAVPVRGGQPAWDEALDMRAAVGVTYTRHVFQRTGLTAYNRLRFFGAEPVPMLETELPDGPWLLVASLQEVIEDMKYVHHLPDVLQPETMARFRALTHERYAQALGDDLALVGSIFTDEVQPEWSPRLLTLYQERHGEALAPQLIALARPDHPRHLEIHHRLEQVSLDAFVETFEAPTSAWCAAHGLRYAGEKPSLRLDQLAWMDLPGCEPGHTKAGAPRIDLLRAPIRANARATASAAYLAGREGALCECFHSLGWGATLQDLRLIADHLLLLGIRYLVPHGVFASAHGLRQHDAPPSIGPEMPWWPLVHQLSARIDRLAMHLDGPTDAAIALLDPSPGCPDAQHAQAYEALQEALLAAHRDWIVIDTQALRTAPQADGVLPLRDLAIRVVIVPPMRLLDDERRERLARFQDAGGTVLTVADAQGIPAAMARLRPLIPPALACVGEHAERLLVTRVRGSRGPRWLVSNPMPIPCAVEFPGEVREVPLQEGVAPRLTRRGTASARTLAPFETIALMPSQPPSRDEQVPVVRLDVRGPAPFTCASSNLLRLDRWQLSLPGGAVGPRLVEPMTLIEQIAASGIALASELERSFGLPPRLRLPPVTVRYAHAVHLEVEADLTLVIEPDGIRGEWRYQIDDGPWRAPGPLGLIDAHLPACGALAIGRLPQGTHALRIEVICTEPDQGLVTALFLGGTVGVALGPLRVTTPVGTGVVGDWAGARLPFYAGVVDYRFITSLDLPPGTQEWVDLELLVPAGFEDALQIRCNDHGWRPVPWSPWRVLVPATELRAGENTIDVRVCSTLDRALTGERFDAAAHAYRRWE